MLQVVNHSRLPAALAVFPDPQGIECAYLAVKASFDLSNTPPRLSARQAAFLATDVYWGDPATSAVRAAGDLTLQKSTTDVILDGCAVSATPVRSMDVEIQVGDLKHRIRVFGNRFWRRHGEAWIPSLPETFERMPLRWEHAYGGQAQSKDGQLDIDWRNPVGRGLVAQDEDNLEGRPLPNLEDPRALITRPSDRPAPTGCAPIAPAWLPRRDYAGTYDENWQRERAPYLPLDFNPAFFNVAAPGLVAPAYLTGGEPVAITGCTQGEPLAFPLPKVALDIKWRFDGQSVPAQTTLDTVLIEPDRSRLQMVWRSRLEVDKKLLRLTEVLVSCSEYPQGQEAD